MIKRLLIAIGVGLGLILGSILPSPAQIIVNSSGKFAGFALVISTASTNATSIKTSPGVFYSVHAVNTNATTAYLKLYNTSGAPTCNTSTVIANFPLVQNVPFNASFPNGASYGPGLGLCITGAQASNDNTNATTGITVTLTYK